MPWYALQYTYYVQYVYNNKGESNLNVSKNDLGRVVRKYLHIPVPIYIIQ